MLGERAIRAEAPSSRQSLPCRGRASPCSSPPPLATSLAAIDGFPRFVRVRRTHWHHCLRRRSHRRRVAPSSSSAPLPVSLTCGALPSVAGLKREPSVGRAASWATPALFAGRCSFGPAQLWLSFVSLFCFVLLFHRFVLIFKNLYFLVYRSKFYGSNFVKLLVMSSI